MSSSKIKKTNTNNKLFIEERSYSSGAWLKTPVDKHFQYSEGYKEASLILLPKFEEFGMLNNFLIYPFVFLFRHYLELRLKELIAISSQLTNSDINLKMDHSLIELWGIFKKQLMIIESETEINELKMIENIFHEFHRIDPNSESFRYPKKKNGIESLQLNTIDIENFGVVIQKLMTFFDNKLEAYFYYVDWSNYLKSDY